MAEVQKLLCRVFAQIECSARDVPVKWPKGAQAQRTLSMRELHFSGHKFS